MQPNERLQDAYIRHQINVDRYSKSQIRRMLKHLDNVETEILAKIAAQNSFSRQNQLEVFLGELRALYRALYRELTKEFEADLRDFASIETDFHSNALDMASQSARINASIQVPIVEAVYAAAMARPMSLRVGMAAPMRDWIEGLEKGASTRVENAIRLGYTEGESIPSIVKRVRAEIMPISRRGAEMLVRTSVNHISSVARSEVFNSNSDIVEGEMWNAILDGRTSTICRDLDGKIFKLGKGKRPPAHPNCRSYMTAILKGFPPPPRTSYAEWFAKQSAEKQDAILGKTKGSLYREGKLPLSAFSNNGKELTLNALKQSNKDAFNYIKNGVSKENLVNQIIPRNLEGKTFTLNNSQNKARQELLRESKKNYYEYINAVDVRNGDVFGKNTDYHHTSVNFSQAGLLEARKRGFEHIQIHHNHPDLSGKGVRTLSPGDILYADNYGFQGIYAHQQDGSFWGAENIKRGAGTKYEKAFSALVIWYNENKKNIPNSHHINIGKDFAHVILGRLDYAGLLNYRYKVGANAIGFDNEIWTYSLFDDIIKQIDAIIFE